MKIFNLLLCSLIVLDLNAQITITSADFATTDDTVRMSLTTDNSIDFVTTGPNQNWDFSYLVAEDQKLVDHLNLDNVPLLVNLAYGTFAAAKYKASYYLPALDLPLDQVSGFLPISIEEPFSYSKLNADSLASVGLSLKIEGFTLPFKSDTIEARYKFPLTYGDSYTGRGYTNIDLDSLGAWIQKRQRTSVVDGWGICKTPYGNFNSIRIRHTIDEQDSLQIDLFGNPIWISLPVPQNFIYEWWTNGEKDAIMRINTRMIAGNEIVTGIEYRDFYLGLDAGINEAFSDQISIYPVPAQDVLNVVGFTPGNTYTILDIQGKVIQEGLLTNAQIDLSLLPQGAYNLLIRSERGLAFKSFVKM